MIFTPFLQCKGSGRSVDSQHAFLVGPQRSRSELCGAAPSGVSVISILMFFIVLRIVFLSAFFVASGPFDSYAFSSFWVSSYPALAVLIVSLWIVETTAPAVFFGSFWVGVRPGARARRSVRPVPLVIRLASQFTAWLAAIALSSSPGIRKLIKRFGLPAILASLGFGNLSSLRHAAILHEAYPP